VTDPEVLGSISLTFGAAAKNSSPSSPTPWSLWTNNSQHGFSKKK
jgi:hypothetical protein